MKVIYYCYVLQLFLLQAYGYLCICAGFTAGSCASRNCYSSWDSWCTGPNDRDAFVVSSSIITKPIGEPDTIFNFQLNPADDTGLGCTCVGVGGWTMTPTYVTGQAVNFGKDTGNPIQKAWLTLAEINSYTEDYRCSPTLYQKTPYTISHGSANAGSGTGGCTTHNPTSATFTVNYVFNCAGANMTASDISDFTVEQTKTVDSGTQIWGSNQNCCCPADVPTYIVTSFPPGMDATTSRSAFTLSYDTITQSLFITAAPSLAIMSGIYTLQLYQQISGQPLINKTFETIVTVTQCAVTLTMTIPSQTHFIGLNSSTSWSLGPSSYTELLNACGYILTYSYTYTGVPSFVTPTLDGPSQSLNLSTTTTDWTLAYSNPSTTMTVTVTANENSAVTVSANVILLLLDGCTLSSIDNSTIGFSTFNVLQTQSNNYNTPLWTESNPTQCLLDPPTVTLLSTPCGATCGGADPTIGITNNTIDMTVSVTAQANSPPGSYTLQIKQCVVGFPTRVICSERIITGTVGMCPDVLTLNPLFFLSKNHTIGYNITTDFVIDLNSFTQTNYLCGYNFSITNSPLPSYLSFSQNSLNNLTVSTTTTDQMLAVSNPSTFVTVTITANENSAITLSFYIQFIIFDPCINTNLVNETVPDMYSTVLNSATTFFQMKVNDTISLDVSSNTNGTNLCINRTYSITSSPMSNSTYTANVLNNYFATPQPLLNNVTIDTSGKITLSASSWSLYGQHNVTVTVNFSPVIFTTFNFYVFIDACQVLNLDLTQQVIPQNYTIADPPLVMNFDNSYAIQTPLCGYNLSFNFLEQSNIIFCNISTNCYAQSLNHNDAGLRNFTQQVSVNYFNISQSFINSTSFLINFIDPCTNTIMICTQFDSLNSINLTSWQGYNSSTPNIFSFSDSISNQVKQNNQTDHFCGNLRLIYQSQDSFDASGLLSWTNDAYVTYSPDFFTTAGQSNGTLIVSLNDFASKTCTQNITLNTISCSPPEIPSIPKYLVGSNIPIEFNFSDFSYENFEVQSHNYSLYIYNGTLDLTSRQILDLNQQDFVIQYPNNLNDPKFLDLDQKSNKFIVFSNDQEKADKQYNIVLVDTQDGKLCYTNFTLNTYWQNSNIIPNTPPYFETDVKTLFNLPGCTDFNWQYKLPELIDDEGDDIEPMIIKINKASIIYDEKNKTFYLVEPVNYNSTVEIQILLQDDKGSNSKYMIKIQFNCSILPIQTKQQQNSIPKEAVPTAKIDKIYKNGTVYISFSQLMYVPKDIQWLNQNLSEDQGPPLQLAVIPSNDLNKKQLNFTYEILNFTGRMLILQLDFQNPLFVTRSIDDPDILEVQFQTQFFQSSIGVTLSQISSILNAKLPWLEDKSFTTSILTPITESAFYSLSATFMLNIIMSFVLQQFWSLIQTQQIIVMIPLFNMRLPGNAVAMFSQILKIAQLDILPIGSLYKSYFDFTKTDPINTNFESIGYESANFMLNLGSMILALCWLLIQSIILVIFHPFKQFRDSKVCKNIRGKLFWKFPISILIQQCSSMILCSFINFTNVRLLSQLLQFQFITTCDIISSILALICGQAVLASPILFGVILYFEFPQLSKKAVKEKIGSLYEDLKLSRGRSVIFALLTYSIRRIILAATIVFSNNFILQVITMQFFQMICLMNLGFASPYEDPMKMKNEYFNEIIIMGILYCTLCFTEFVSDPVQQYNMGYVCCLLNGFHLFVNLLLILKDSINSMRLSYIRFKNLRNYKKLRKVAKCPKNKKKADANTSIVKEIETKLQEIQKLEDQEKQKQNIEIKNQTNLLKDVIVEVNGVVRLDQKTAADSDLSNSKIVQSNNEFKKPIQSVDQNPIKKRIKIPKNLEKNETDFILDELEEKHEKQNVTRAEIEQLQDEKQIKNVYQQFEQVIGKKSLYDEHHIIKKNFVVKELPNEFIQWYSDRSYRDNKKPEINSKVQESQVILPQKNNSKDQKPIQRAMVNDFVKRDKNTQKMNF